MEQTRGLFCMCDSGVARCQSLLANALHVQSALHGQVRLAAVNNICVNYEAMNDCKI